MVGIPPARAAIRRRTGHDRRHRADARHPAQREGGVRGAILDLQSKAGNAAVAQALCVQRHSSFEHSLFGNTKPKDLASAAGKLSSGSGKHVIEAERDRAKFFKADPRQTPDTTKYPFDGVEMVKLARSDLWVTYGEIDALADYLPNGHDINQSTAGQLLPILQYMRNEIANACSDLASSGKVGAGTVEAKGWTGAQKPTSSESALGAVSKSGAKVKVEDDATAGRGSQSYTGLLSRNACHFAPESWSRYAFNHELALKEARESARLSNALATAPDDMTRAQWAEDAKEKATQAEVDNGYADHFMEDSFAAGHLINKTLVMQWFMEWVQTQHAFNRSGLPGAAMNKVMNSSSQKRIAGQDLYAHMKKGDIATNVTEVDPQTATEIRNVDAEGRAEFGGAELKAGSSEKDVAHQYYEFFRLTALQLAAGSAHDHFNALTSGGLTVKNKRGDQFTVGGDDSGFQNSNDKALEIIGDAVTGSLKAVKDTISGGSPAQTTDDLLSMVPSTVVLGTGEVDLQTWNEDVVHKLCTDTLFPELWKSTDFDIARSAGPTDSTANPDLAATQ